MSNLHEALSRYRLPLKPDHLMQARDLAAPVLRYAPRNPLLLIGAGVLALVGILAWTNREKIAAKAGPMLEDARAKGQTMLEEANAKGHELLDGAMAKGEVVAEKLASASRRAAARSTGADIH